jgi:hypothetical protein
MATALTGSVASDGQTTPSANLPMGGFAHTNVGNATVRNMYPSAGQVQDGSLTYLTSVSGADTITAVGAVGMTAYAAGQQFTFVSAGANTGAATLNINSIGAKAITKNGTTALAAGDIASGAVAEVVYDGTQFQLISAIPISSLSLPVSVANGGTGLTSAGTSGNVLTSNGTAWVSSAPVSGKVLQVINASLGSNFSTTSSSMVDSGLSLSITPSSTSSTILVTFNLHASVEGYRAYSSGGYAGEFYNIVRNSTSLLDTSNYTDQGLNNGLPKLGWNSSVTYFPTVNSGGVPFQLIDSPSSTSAVTYKVQISTGLSGWTNPSVSLFRTSSITLMEIAA